MKAGSNNRRGRRSLTMVARVAGVGAGLALLPCAASGQSQIETTPRFERYGIAEGLPPSTVRAIARDSRGFLWIGTREGVDRYDGYDFVTYRPSPGDDGSLSGGSVVAIATGPNGDLWIGTASGGLDRYDVDNDAFEHFPGASAFGPGDGSVVLAVMAASSGRVRVGTSAGRLALDPDAPPAPFERILGESVHALAEDSAGRILAATGAGTLVRMTGDAHDTALQQWNPGLYCREFVRLGNEGAVLSRPTCRAGRDRNASHRAASVCTGARCPGERPGNARRDRTRTARPYVSAAARDSGAAKVSAGGLLDG